jgi:transketolase C-terminal domain/subunit
VIRGIGFNIGTSGYLEELLQHYGLDDSGIARTAIKLVNVLNP